MDDPGIAAVTRAGVALLSPTLCSDERDRLEGVLTHELSHVHLSGWRPLGAPRPPQWFTEGLAVMASNGGGAEGVSEAEAAQAIRDGYRVVLDGRRWIDFAMLAFEREPPRHPKLDALTQRQRLAYRQAGMFVGWLRMRDEKAFLQLLRALEAGEAFEPSVEVGLRRKRAVSFWRRFVSDLSQRRARAALATNGATSLQEHINIDVDIRVVALKVGEIFLDDEVLGVEPLLVEIGGDRLIGRFDLVIGAAMLEFERLAGGRSADADALGQFRRAFRRRRQTAPSPRMKSRRRQSW